MQGMKLRKIDGVVIFNFMKINVIFFGKFSKDIGI